MIDGVIVQELKQICDERGKVLHMLRSDSPLFTRFGEIYFSTVNSGAVKAWKKHFKMAQHFAVPVGRIMLVLYDDRKGSATYKNVEVLDIGEDCYCLVKIPPLLWYGFKGISSTPALVANMTDIPHDPNEAERLSPFDSKIPYNWDVSKKSKYCLNYRKWLSSSLRKMLYKFKDYRGRYDKGL